MNKGIYKLPPKTISAFRILYLWPFSGWRDHEHAHQAAIYLYLASTCNGPSPIYQLWDV